MTKDEFHAELQGELMKLCERANEMGASFACYVEHDGGISTIAHYKNDCSAEFKIILKEARLVTEDQEASTAKSDRK